MKIGQELKTSGREPINDICTVYNYNYYCLLKKQKIETN